MMTALMKQFEYFQHLKYYLINHMYNKIMPQVRIQDNKNKKAMDNDAELPVDFVPQDSGEVGAYYDLRVEYNNLEREEEEKRMSTALAFIGMGQDVWSFPEPSRFPIPGYPKAASDVSSDEKIKFTYRHTPGSLTSSLDSGRVDITSSFILDIWLGKRGTDAIDGQGRRVYDEAMVIDVIFAKYIPLNEIWEKEFQPHRKLWEEKANMAHNRILHRILLMEQEPAPQNTDSRDWVSQEINLTNQINDAFEMYSTEPQSLDDYDVTGIEIGAEIVPLNDVGTADNHISSIGIQIAEFTYFSPQIVPDTTPPVITLIGTNPQIIELGDTYTELGATATDNDRAFNGNAIQIDSSAVDTSTVGTYEVTYNVSDPSGNAAVTVIRTVNVVDTTPPVITLKGSSQVTLEAGVDTYKELGATATDNVDGIFAATVGGDTVDTNTVKKYIVTYSATDTEGNTADPIHRTVKVQDTTPPVITLIGANPQIIVLDGAYTELGATATDNDPAFNGNAIQIDSSAVDTSTVGTYEVTYNVSDPSGNAAVTVIRTVHVIYFKILWSWSKLFKRLTELYRRN